MTALFNRQQLTATALIRTGLAKFSRQLLAGDASVLTFHGILGSNEGGDLLDPSLHCPDNLFHDLCAHLAEHYRVLPLEVIAKKLLQSEPLPDHAVALTFDDGYESNHRLAFPVLREFGLPATVFLCTGFIDGTVQPWFIRLELAMTRATARHIDIRIGGVHLHYSIESQTEGAAVLPAMLRVFKQLPQSEVESNLERLITALQPQAGSIPAPLRPMNWSQARDLRDSGLISFGAHTHTHPILSRCSVEVARQEIFTSRDRIIAELGSAPSLFAYPNGHAGDYNPDTMKVLQEAGFIAAFTMTPGRAGADSGQFELPRYGSPESLQQAEATVSGAYETFKSWRQNFRRAFTI